MTPIDHFISTLQAAIQACPLAPAELWSTFAYTTTGNNLCHPRTLGLLAKAAWTLPDAVAVDIDVRMNSGAGVKFQPDIMVRAADRDLLAVDFESPNSSDARLPVKDVAAYIRWMETRGSPFVAYLVITSLPDRPTPDWQLRYASSGYYNHGHAKSSIQTNPCAYWYGQYRTILGTRHPNWSMYPLTIANLDGRRIAKMIESPQPTPM